jgi:hypothetical protein
MAVAFDDASVTSGTTISDFSHTCTGSDLCLYVFVMADTIPDPSPGVAVTYNGVALTQIAEVGIIVGTGFRYNSLHRLVNPATGSNTVAVANEPATVNKAVIALSFTGVDQADPDDAPVTHESSAQTCTDVTVSSAIGDMVLSGIAVDGGGTNAVIASSNLTQDANGAGPGTGFASRTGYIDGDTSIVPNWDWTAAGNQNHSHIGVNINAAAGGGGGFDPATAHFLPAYPATHKKVWGTVPSGMLPPNRFGS